jgi:chemotaxis protein histidine kinase CheA
MGDGPMSVDAFADRLVRVRRGFVSSVEGRIDDAHAAIPNLSDVVPAAAASLADVYRSMHAIVGIGQTVGFPATGRAARDVEEILRSAYSNGRGLTSGELSLFESSLAALRKVASCELQSAHTVGE